MWKQNLITVSPSIFMLKVPHINEAHFTVLVIISTYQVPFRSASQSLNKVRNLIGLSSQHQQIPWGELPPQFRSRTAGLDPGNSKRQCWRGEDVFLIAILQIAKPAAVRLNNLSKMDKGGAGWCKNSALQAAIRKDLHLVLCTGTFKSVSWHKWLWTLSAIWYWVRWDKGDEYSTRSSWQVFLFSPFLMPSVIILYPWSYHVRKGLFLHTT